MENPEQVVDIFQQCGLLLNNEKVVHNVLQVDQRRFQSNLQKLIKQNRDQSWMQEMIAGYLDANTENFLISLLPTKVSSESVSVHSSFQDNLLKLLMEMDELQTFLFDYLLNKLVTVCNNETSEDELTSVDQILGIQIDVVTYIVNQFKFQPRIIDPEGVCEKLIAAVKKIRSSPVVKSEIVACFPDILSDCSHDKITQDLEDLIDDADLVSVVLETHASLKIKPENVKNMVERLFDKLDASSVNPADLAAVVKYILRSAAQTGSKEILYELRNKLTLDSIKDAKARFQVFDVIRLFFQCSNDLIDLYTSLMSQLATKEAGSLTTSLLGVTKVSARSSSLLRQVDMIVFATLYSMANQSGRVDKLFQQILKDFESSSSMKQLVQATFRLGNEITRELFAPMCTVAKSLITSAASSVCLMASHVYVIAFASLEPKYKLMLINTLVDMAKNSNGVARDNALDTLIKMSNKDTVSISHYTKQIRTLIDYIEFFSIGQTRKIYYIMCSIVYCSNASSTMMFSDTISSNSSSSQASSVSFTGKDSSIQNDMNVLINKQLTSNMLKYKKIGVIGALMTIKNMASKISSSAAQGANSAGAGDSNQTLCGDKNQSSVFDFDAGIYCSQALTTSQIADTSEMSESERLTVTTVELKNIWTMVIESSRACSESLGLFEDDLTSLVYKSSLPACIEELLKENVKKLVANLFAIDNGLREKLSKQTKSFRVDYDYGLGREAHGGVLNLIPLVQYESQRRQARAQVTEAAALQPACQLSPVALASTIRLMIALERHNLAELDEYLSLPVFAVKKSDLYKYAGFANLVVAQSETGMSGNENLFLKFREQLTDSERKQICDTLFFTINWFIELVNGFSSCLRAGGDRQAQVDSMRAKLISRLTTVIELQQIVQNLLPYMNKFYRPPMAVFGLVEASELPQVDSMVKRREAKKPSKAKKAAKKVDKKTKRPMAKKKLNSSDPDESTLNNEDNEIEDDEAAMEEKELVESSDEQQEDGGVDVVDSAKLALFFREFDLSIIHLIGAQLDLNLDDKLNTSVNSSTLIEQISHISSSKKTGNGQNQLNPFLLHFILADLNAKFLFIFKAAAAAATTQSFASTFGHAAQAQTDKEQSKIQLFCELNAPSASELAKSFLNESLDHVLGHLETVRKHFKHIQSQNDSIRDPAEVTNKPTNLNLLKCFNQMLKLLHTYFNWLQKNAADAVDSAASGQDLVALTIRKVAMATTAAKDQPVVQQQVESFCFNFFYRLKDVVLDLSTANLLVQILDMLLNKLFKDHCQLSESHEAKIRATLIEACFEFLQLDYNPKFNSLLLTSKQANNEAVDNMLKTIFSNYGATSAGDNKSSVDLMLELCKIISSVEFRVDRDNSGKYLTLKTNFTTYYRFLLERSVSLAKQVRKCELSVARDLDAQLERIKQIVYIHSTLVMLKKDGSFREINILTVLKNSKLFLTHFLKNSMSWLDQAFESHKTDVMDLLQSVHQCTNYMQEVCLTTAQIPVVKQTPGYMRCVEAFVLRVKELLYVNDCDEAITVDLLLNKFEKSSRSVAAAAAAAAKKSTTANTENGGAVVKKSTRKKRAASGEENTD